MSGEYDVALFEALKLGDDGVEAFNTRAREIHAESGEDAVTWIVDRTRFAYNRSVSVQLHRQALTDALDAIEQAAAAAAEAMDMLGRRGDRNLLPYLGHDAVIHTGLATIRLAVAGAKHHAPDPDAPETDV
jgi:hypothetical protein